MSSDFETYEIKNKIIRKLKLGISATLFLPIFGTNGPPYQTLDGNEG